MDIKETTFFPRFISSLQHGQNEIFGKVNEVNLYINIIVFKNFAFGTF